MDRLDGVHVLVGVSGSIAAYRALDLVRELRARGATVRVALTKGAAAFVTPLTFAAISGAPVMTSSLDVENGKIPHIEEARRTKLAIVAPASANTLAKMAHGFADDALLSTLLSYDGPLIIAPAMESQMWHHPATVENVRTLSRRGALIAGPVSGPLASGRSGDGRMAPIADIVEAAMCRLAPQDFSGVSVLITAGPTVEKLDPVRALTNRSSGKMGIALARVAAQRGARVTLVHGPLDVAVPVVPGLHAVPVQSASDMLNATLDVDADVAILAAAVADFRPAVVAVQKIKKGNSETLTVELARTDDILATLGQRRTKNARPFLVGFAAETENVVENAREKLRRKNADLICANDVSDSAIGFGSDENEMTLVFADADVFISKRRKDQCAEAILDAVVARIGTL